MLNQADAWLPWGTLAANLAGGLLARAWRRGGCKRPCPVNPVWRLAPFTGFLGALTTFSAFSLEGVEMQQAQRWWPAVMAVGLYYGRHAVDDARAGLPSAGGAAALGLSVSMGPLANGSIKPGWWTLRAISGDPHGQGA